MNKSLSILPPEFYTRSDVVGIARAVLGKKLVSTIGGALTSVIITETEAYEGEIDKASHAYGGRRTKRTETMYRAGGCAYVYLCYGLHHLFNIVTNVSDVPHAVLLRAGEPLEGIDLMLCRRNKTLVKNLCAGPGTLSQALGITVKADGIDLSGLTVYVKNIGIRVAEEDILASPRVGVGYAQEHALWPYRFRIKPESESMAEVAEYIKKHRDKEQL